MYTRLFQTTTVQREKRVKTRHHVHVVRRPLEELALDQGLDALLDQVGVGRELRRELLDHLF